MEVGAFFLGAASAFLIGQERDSSRFANYIKNDLQTAREMVARAMNDDRDNDSGLSGASALSDPRFNLRPGKGTETMVNIFGDRDARQGMAHSNFQDRWDWTFRTGLTG